MTSLEMNALAEGIFRYLREKCPQPIDGIGVLGTTLLMLYDNANNGNTTLEQFAEDFKVSLVESYKTRSDNGSAGLQ